MIIDACERPDRCSSSFRTEERERLGLKAFDDRCLGKGLRRHNGPLTAPTMKTNFEHMRHWLTIGRVSI